MRKKIILISFFLVFSILFSSCTGKEEREKYIEETDSKISVILLGKHANCVEPDYLNIKNIVLESYMSFGSASFVMIDGEPNAIMDDDKVLGANYKNDVENSKKMYLDNNIYWENNINELTEYIENILKQQGPNNNEADIMSSIILGNDLLNSIDTSDSSIKELYVYDSGISTYGIIDFTKTNFLELSEDEIKEFLQIFKEKNELPDLTNVNVKWYGIGNTSKPQENLTHGEKNNLIRFWKTVIEFCNGEFEDVPYISEKSNDSAYSVTPVSFDSDTIEYSEKSEEISESIYCVYFASGKSEYVDEDSQIKTLKEMAENSQRYSSKWYIIGCEAGKTNDGIQELDNHISTARAKKVKSDLENLGVDENKLIMCSLGPHDPWHIEDYIGEDWIDDLAKGNRRVFIINENDELIKENKAIIDKGIITE